MWSNRLHHTLTDASEPAADLDVPKKQISKTEVAATFEEDNARRLASGSIVQKCICLQPFRRRSSYRKDNEGHNRKQVDDLQKRVQDTEQELLSVIGNANGRETDLRFQLEKEQGERLALERQLVEMNEQMAEVASMNWREGLRYGREGVRATPGRLPPPTPRKGVQL